MTRNRPPTRRDFLTAGAGAVAATTVPTTTLAFDGGDATTTVEIRRDDFGVPHVYAPGADTRPPVFFGYGYAVAEDRLFQLEMYRRVSRGTVSAVLGDDWVDFDRQARTTFNRPGTDLDRQYDEHLSDADRASLEALADGINRYIDAVEAGKREFHKGFVDNGFEPERWTGTDIAAVWVSVGRIFSFQLETAGALFLSQLNQELFADLQWGNDPSSPTSIGAATEGYTPPYTEAGDSLATEEEPTDRPNRPGGAASSSPNQEGPAGDYRIPADPKAAHEAAIEQARTLAAGLDDLGLPIKLGSKALAVDAEHTESGDALLFGGPQFGFSSPSTAYEVGWHGEDFDVVGTTIPPLPMIFFGHNRHGAFTGTAGLDNTIQTFVETIREAEDGDGYEYKFKGEWLPVEETTEEIPVKGDDDDSVTIRNTRHGVVTMWTPPGEDEETGQAIARSRGYEGRELIDMAEAFEYCFASDAEEFVEAAEQFNYSFNAIWAGESGDIAFAHSGRVPDWGEVPWDTRLPAPGPSFDLTDEDYLYGDGDMPSAIDPERGYVANWNNKPAPGWNNGDLSFFWGPDGRVQRIINLVAHRLETTGSVSYEYLKAVDYDTSFVDLAAIRFKEPLLEALDDAELSDTEEAARAALAEWDNFRQGAGEDHFGPYPVGYTVFSEFFPILLRKTFRPTFGRLYPALVPLLDSNTGGSSLLMRAIHDEEAALEPAVDYFDEDQDGVFRAAFEEAVSDLGDEFGTDVTEWQTDAQVDSLDNLALFGMPIGVGDPGEMPYLNRGTQNHFVRVGSERNDFRAENIVPPGNSGYVAPDGTQDEHYADQLDPFVGFEYKRLRSARNEVVRGTESTTRLHRD